MHNKREDWNVSKNVTLVIFLEFIGLSILVQQNTLVSEDADDENNLRTGSCEFFLNQFHWIFKIKFTLKELI